ncbi:MAG: hypothetical protein AAB444_01600 [Patescibacteria group bacterium]
MAQEMEKQGGETLSWKIHEYTHYEHGPLWYAGIIIAGAVLLISALWSRNFLFAFIIIMFAMVFLAHAGRHPEELDFSISESGVKLGERRYAWKEIKGFFIIYEPPEVKILYFDFNGPRPTLAVPLNGEDPVTVRAALIRFLPEDTTQNEEPFADWIGRVLKI